MLWFASHAHAFSDQSLYGKYPSQAVGGGGGRYFTGSPADGYSCSVCHSAPVDYSFPLYQTGLPTKGYIPGRTYTVKLQWPEAAAWAAQYGDPMTSLTAEFVSEDAGNAGTLQLGASALTKPTELCPPQPDPEDPTRDVQALAASIDSVARGLDPAKLRSEKEVCETGGEEQRRCVFTVRPCRTSEAQMRWTAPSQLRGPIWFSAAFVASDSRSGVPNDFDYVTELTIPINSADDGPTYETRLESGCSVGGVGRPGSSAWGAGWMLLTFLGLLCGARGLRLSAAVLCVSSAAAALFMASSCTNSDPQAYLGEHSAAVGAFEPSNRLDAGSQVECIDETIPAPKAGDTVNAGGTLTVSFTTTPPAGVLPGQGHYDGMFGPTPSFGVVWIEDSMKHYVKLLEIWGKRFIDLNLTYYLFDVRYGCAQDADVMTSATRMAHELHTLPWDGKTVDGDLVPNGKYKLWFEVSIDEVPEHKMRPQSVEFEMKDSAWTLQFPDTPPYKELTLTFVPGATAPTGMTPAGMTPAGTPPIIPATPAPTPTP